MIAIKAIKCIATLAGLTLVAMRMFVVIKISASRALHDIPGYRRHVANLGACARNYCARENGITRTHNLAFCHGCITGRSTDQKAARGGFQDCGRQGCDIYQLAGPFDILPHQINQICAASQIFCFVTESL
jgi:hypothetical protein